MRKKPMLTLLSTAVLTAVAAMSVPVNTVVAASRGESPSAARKFDNNAYVVRMAELPVVAYDGGIKGLAATKPRKGQKIDPNSPQVLDYKRFLELRHDAVLASVGGGRKLYSYGYVFNGFAAELTEGQVQKLASVPGVLSVSRDELHYADTSSTPKFLGLDAPGGLWEQLGGVGSAGENVIIGIIDSGIWPENLSFSDRTGTNGNASKDGKLSYQQIPGWHGRCVPGEAFNASMCNQKLIGARHYNEGQGGDAGINASRPWEFTSVRDYDGHGSHTAATSGGNYNTTVTGPFSVVGATASGMAPRARIAAYKALWAVEDASTASGTTSDLVAAIDQAVADGVDVINYSVSGSSTNFRDPVEISFLFAAQAGVFVAASAGNSGPTSSTVAHPSPWITTVAAGTHDRNYEAKVTLGNGANYTGASVNQTGVGPAPLVDSTAAGKAGADPTQVALCYSSADGGNALDPAKVAGKIVVCDRGVTNRVNKSLAVAEAGGVGMILVNTSPNSLNGDFHSVPTVHLQNTDRAAVKAYAATAGATAQIFASKFAPVAAPFTASFSSRGPLRASGDLLKPDLIAPGQDILAAFSPVVGGLDFNQISGTSMSSPHVAGLAAALKDLHPTWSPMAIKSALMTTGYDVLDGGTPAPNTNPVLIFRQGAGHVAPNKAADPGLVFDSSYADWLGFLCGTQLPTSFCTSAGVPVLDPSDFNSASIAIADLAGTQTVKRRVTNVGGKSTYNVSITAAGLTVAVTPASFTLNPGQTQDLQIAITRTTAALNAYTGAQITWSDGKHSVRIPVVARPVALAAPAEVSGSYGVTFGYTGAFTATARGLVPAAISAGTVADDPTDATCSLTAPNAQLIPVAVPAGTTYARFSLFDADVNPGSDIDMCVFNGSTLVGSSGSGTSAEQVSLTDPAAGNYTVVVQGWGVDGSSPFKLHTWLLGSAAAGNMTVSAPATATLGITGNIGLAFNGLAAGTKYLGSVAYGGVAGMPSPTIVRVDVP